MQIKLASVVVVIKNGKILSVSRKDNFNDFALPGGKIENWECASDAAIRELEEETGIIAIGKSSKTPKLIYEGLDGMGYYVYTYLISEWAGEVHTKEAGKIAWLDPEELITKSSFGKYNRKIFEAMGLIEDEQLIKNIMRPSLINSNSELVIASIVSAIISIASLYMGLDSLNSNNYIPYFFFLWAVYGAFLCIVAILSVINRLK